jgi:hypothetical protein
MAGLRVEMLAPCAINGRISHVFPSATAVQSFLSNIVIAVMVGLLLSIVFILIGRELRMGFEGGKFMDC